MKKILVVTFLGLVCCSVFGEVVTATGTVTLGEVAKTSIISELLRYIPEAIALAFTVLTGFFFKWLKTKAADDQAKSDAIDSIKVGVDHAWNELGSGLKDALQKAKAAGGDGKLTAEQKIQLRNLAIAKAKEVATGDGAKVLEKWGFDVIVAKIKEVIDNRKAKSAMGK